MENSKKKKVIVAISGGVDSSVAAALLKRAGFEVIGVFMRFWSERVRGSRLISADKNVDFRKFKNQCFNFEAEMRAKKIAKILKIPFCVFDFKKEFKKKIVDYFLVGYKKGSTPNPCVVCNKEIKFGLFLERALKLNADYVATGHYARLKKISENSCPNSGKFARIKLLKAKDKNKDQSYFLWMLNQEQLKRILFPLGNYTRKEVENLAKKFKLPVLKAKKSVEICFIKTSINDFLKQYLKQKPGLIVEKKHSDILKNVGISKRILGSHQGLWFYTIGQRKGIGLSGGPYYVLDKDLKKNLLIVTKNERDLYKRELQAKNVNWISGKEPKLPLKVKAKIRYRQKAVPAVIIKNLKSKIYNLKFEKPQRAITPGQSVVFYSLSGKEKNQEVLGGGIIC